LKKKIIISRQDIIPTPIGNIWESLKSVVYGPIVSRRFRYSLGINLFSKKICPLNCTYCDLGHTDKQHVKNELTDYNSLFKPEKIAIDIEKAFLYHKLKNTEIDKITICGNGEATIHPEFPEIVDIVIRMRDTYFPKIQTAILSAPTEINNEKIVSALEKIDVRVLKLDAADVDTYKRICRPIQGVAGLDFKGQLAHLNELSKRFKYNITISSAIVRSDEKKYKNIGSIINNIPDILSDINPAEYHIHNIDYPIFDNDSSVLRLKLEEMIEIAEKIAERTDVPIKVLHSAISLRENNLEDYKPQEYQQPFDFKPRILLLEDDRKFQQSIISALSKYFEFYSAYTLDKAKNMFGDSFNAMAVDINLNVHRANDLGGLEFIKWAKKRSNIPFVVITGYRDGEILDKIRSEEPFYIFSRTLDILTLKDKLFQCVYKSML